MKHHNIKPFALSIKGGSVYGFGAIGVIRFFQENELTATSVGGSSSGAMIAAMYALGLHWTEMLQEIKKIQFRKLLSIRSTLQTGTLVDYERYRSAILGFRGDVDFENLAIPLVIFATDPIENKRVFLRKGSIVNAILASSGYPPIFPSVAAEGSYGRKLVDGDFTPGYSTNELKTLGAEKIIGIAYKSLIKPKQLTGNLLQRTLLIQQLYSLILDKQDDAIDPADYEVEYSVGTNINRFNISNVDRIAHRGYIEAMRNKDKIIRALTHNDTNRISGTLQKD